MEQLVKNSLRLLLWMVLAVLSVAATGWLFMAHFMGAVSGFELLGYEARPLRTIPLVGPFLGSFFGEASLCEFYGLALTGAIALGLFISANLLFRLFELIRALAQSLQADYPDRISDVALELFQHALVTAALAFPLYWVLRWDFEIFQYRALAGRHNISDSTLAVGSILTPAAELAQNSDLFATELMMTGAIGYVGVSFVLCLGVELCIMKMGETWSAITKGLAPPVHYHDEVDEEAHQHWSEEDYEDEGDWSDYDEAALDDSVDGNDMNGGLADGWPERDDSDEGWDTEETPDAGQSLWERIRTAIPRRGHRRANAESEVLHEAAETETWDETGVPTSDHVFDEELEAGPELDLEPPVHAEPELQRLSAGASPAAACNDEPLREVIGGARGERVSLTEALADRHRFVVDPRTRQIWRRSYWEAIHDIE